MSLVAFDGAESRQVMFVHWRRPIDERWGRQTRIDLEFDPPFIIYPILEMKLMGLSGATILVPDIGVAVQKARRPIGHFRHTGSYPHVSQQVMRVKTLLAKQLEHEDDCVRTSRTDLCRICGEGLPIDVCALCR